MHPNELLGSTYKEVIAARASTRGHGRGRVAGCVQQFGEQSFNITRNAWLQAGLPLETPGTTVDRQCGSAQQAVNFAAALIAAGVHDVVIGGGVEHMGHLPLAVGRSSRHFGSPFTPALMDSYNIVDQGLSAPR